MKIGATLTIALLATACGSKKDEPAPETKAKTEPRAEARPDAAPAPPPAPAPVDPASFVAVDLSPVAAIAQVTAKAPPGAAVVADQPPLGETAPLGAVIEQGGFALHLWWSTTGGERTVRPMQADMAGGKYVETTSTPELVEYTVETSGTKTYGFFLPVDGMRRGKLGDAHGQLLCGPAREVATPEDLAPYRAACDTVAKKP